MLMSSMLQLQSALQEIERFARDAWEEAGGDNAIVNHKKARTKRSRIYNQSIALPCQPIADFCHQQEAAAVPFFTITSVAERSWWPTVVNRRVRQRSLAPFINHRKQDTLLHEMLKPPHTRLRTVMNVLAWALIAGLIVSTSLWVVWASHQPRPHSMWGEPSEKPLN